MTATDVSIPVPAVTASTSAMGALTGLTGYMKLGLGAKVKPGVVKITDSEVLVTKDSASALLLLCLLEMRLFCNRRRSIHRN